MTIEDDIKVVATLRAIWRTCDNWDEFCNDNGFDPWVCNNGYGDSIIELTVADAFKYGIIRKGE